MILPSDSRSLLFWKEPRGGLVFGPIYPGSAAARWGNAHNKAPQVLEQI